MGPRKVCSDADPHTRRLHGAWTNIVHPVLSVTHLDLRGSAAFLVQVIYAAALVAYGVVVSRSPIADGQRRPAYKSEAIRKWTLEAPH
jgi:hypothetical protein